MFSNAKTLKTATKKKTEKTEVKISGLETLAAIDHVMKSLAALKETVESDVKSAMASHFVTTGCATQRRPENFKGVDGVATASCELRLRSSRSALSDAEIEALDHYSIPHVLVEDVAETFVINPAYKDDQKLLAQIEKKLKAIKDIPEDFIMVQEGVSRHVVVEESIERIFTLNPNVASSLLPIVGTLAVKPKLDVDDVAQAYAIVEALLD